MAETTESSAITETKKVINPRVEIDTSPPFESVKEAVNRFGGSGPWIPLHLLRLAAAAHHETEDNIDLERIEEQAVQLERDLIVKEQETLNVLKQVEATKKFVQALKLNLMPPLSMACPHLKTENHTSVNDENTTGLMLMELNQAKLNLNKTSGDLALIQASVESLNKRKNHQVENARGPDISKAICRELIKQVNFEAEQFKKMTEASRYEVIKAMAEIERTKNSIRMAEMRLNAAKKMEEAAKAVQVIALMNGESSRDDDFMPKPAGVSLSFEEYRALSRKAHQAEDLCKTKFIDTNAIQRINASHQIEVPFLEKFEENAIDNTPARQVDLFNEEGPHRTNVVADNFRTTSIGDILSRKLMLHDDVMVGRRVENNSERQRISLSQMLREQSGLILHSPKTTADRNVEKQYFIQRKKFGFIQVPLPTKQNKKKMQPLNLR